MIGIIRELQLASGSGFQFNKAEMTKIGQSTREKLILRLIPDKIFHDLAGLGVLFGGLVVIQVLMGFF